MILNPTRMQLIQYFMKIGIVRQERWEVFGGKLSLAGFEVVFVREKH